MSRLRTPLGALALCLLLTVPAHAQLEPDARARLGVVVEREVAGLDHAFQHAQHLADAAGVAVELLHARGRFGELLEIDRLGERAAFEFFRGEHGQHRELH